MYNIPLDVISDYFMYNEHNIMKTVHLVYNLFTYIKLLIHYEVT
jgi:hypothetical protein